MISPTVGQTKTLRPELLLQAVGLLEEYAKDLDISRHMCAECTRVSFTNIDQRDNWKTIQSVIKKLRRMAAGEKVHA